MSLRHRIILTINNSNNSGINVDNYLTMTDLSGGLSVQLSINDCEYCIDGDGVWVALAAGTGTPSLSKGQTISFRGTLTPNSSTGIGTFTVSGSCGLSGNCMSMLFGDEAANNKSLSGKSYAFYKLFQSCTGIKSVSSDFLPATTLATYCYRNMFYGCTGLTSAPSLPSTSLSSYCYHPMFRGCTSLTSAPSLPATTMQTYCYAYMFYGCTKLSTVPSLSSTSLANYCYYYMFRGCTSITSPPALPATTLKTYCYSYMFYGCTGILRAPILNATTLVTGCYNYMFYNCSSLWYIKAMFTTAPSESYTKSWVYGVSTATSCVFLKNTLATWDVTGEHGIPSGWQITLA